MENIIREKVSTKTEDNTLAIKDFRTKRLLNFILPKHTSNRETSPNQKGKVNIPSLVVFNPCEKSGKILSNGTFAISSRDKMIVLITISGIKI